MNNLIKNKGFYKHQIGFTKCP